MNGFNTIFWLLLFLVFLICEIISLGLTTIWFAGGALVAFIATLAGGNLVVQIVLFLAVSLILLFVTRPIAIKYLNLGKSRTNIEGIIGKTAKVTSAINNNSEVGEVIFNGEKWLARSSDGTIIEEDEMVEIISVEGVKLFVKKA